MRWKYVGKSSFANKIKTRQGLLVLLYDPFIARKELKRVLLLHGTAWAFTNLQRFYAHPCCGVRQHYSIAIIMPMRKILQWLRTSIHCHPWITFSSKESPIVRIHNFFLRYAITLNRNSIQSGIQSNLRHSRWNLFEWWGYPCSAVRNR